jgi:hypothetical protein
MGLRVIQRYFRSDLGTYEAVRDSLDASWGFPDAGTRSCVLPADEPTAPIDNAGRIYLAVTDEWCQWDEVAAVLPGLLASGAVEEVTREQYLAALPPGP